MPEDQVIDRVAASIRIDRRAGEGRLPANTNRDYPAAKFMQLSCQKADIERAADVFGGATAAPVDLAPLHAKIGQLALEDNFLERALTKAGLLSATP